MTTRRTLLGAAVAAALTCDPNPARAGETMKLDLSAYDKIEPVKYPWGWLRWLMNDQIDPKAELTLGLAYIEPHQSNQLHLHPNSAEILHVLVGSCEHRRGAEWIKLKAGDTLRIPKNTPHMARTQDQPFVAFITYDTGSRVMVPITDDKAK
jgi:quercetin dioxygenase-like cupin family protein